jgi:hypothetical protein
VGPVPDSLLLYLPVFVVGGFRVAIQEELLDAAGSFTILGARTFFPVASAFVQPEAIILLL